MLLTNWECRRGWGGGAFFFFSPRFFGKLNDLIDTRQINRRKINLISYIWELKKWSEQEAFVSSRQRKNKSLENWQGKEFGFGVINWWGNNKAYLCSLLPPNFLSLEIGYLFPFRYWEGALHLGYLFSAFRETWEGQSVLLLAVF